MAGFIDDDTIDVREYRYVLNLLRGVSAHLREQGINPHVWVTALGTVTAAMLAAAPAEDRDATIALFLLRFREELTQDMGVHFRLQAGATRDECATSILEQSERDRRAH